jgi:hypothetical protein
VLPVLLKLGFILFATGDGALMKPKADAPPPPPIPEVVDILLLLFD